MKLNLPILDHLKNCQNILIAGAGGGFDIFAGLPLYFTLIEQGKTVHLANLTFTPLSLMPVLDEPTVLIPDLLVGANGKIKRPFSYYPEGYLAQWFREVHDTPITVWMLAKTGVKPLIELYRTLINHLGGIDAIILVDGGVDSIMRGDEVGAGTVLEDTITLAAVDQLDIRVKILACLGFGCEVEEGLCHHNALENMAALAGIGAFYGSCALTIQMDAFQRYERACRYVWDQPDHATSHISTRIIPAVNGIFGNYELYPTTTRIPILLSPLMSLYWFFEAGAVTRRNILAKLLEDTYTADDALSIVMHTRAAIQLRPRAALPY